MLTGCQSVYLTIDGSVGGIVDSPQFASGNHGLHFVLCQAVLIKGFQPGEVILTKEMMEQQHRHKAVPGSVRLQDRGRQALFIHQLAHHSDATAFCFGKVDVVKYSGNFGIACFGTRLTKSLVCLEGIAGVSYFKAIAVADDLD